MHDFDDFFQKLMEAGGERSSIRKDALKQTQQIAKAAEASGDVVGQFNEINQKVATHTDKPEQYQWFMRRVPYMIAAMNKWVDVDYMSNVERKLPSTPRDTARLAQMLEEIEHFNGVGEYHAPIHEVPIRVKDDWPSIKASLTAIDRAYQQQLAKRGDTPRVTHASKAHDNAYKFLKIDDNTAWWFLGVSGSPEEGKAMGHCGNGNHSPGSPQRVISLRSDLGTRKQKPHLTFILHLDEGSEDSGWLGEMKGRANEKPAVKYHDAIEALLHDDRIKGIKGGGYMASNNFAISDMDPERAKANAEKKPELKQTIDKFKMGEITKQSLTDDNRLVFETCPYLNINESGQIVFKNVYPLSQDDFFGNFQSSHSDLVQIRKYMESASKNEGGLVNSFKTYLSEGNNAYDVFRWMGDGDLKDAFAEKHNIDTSNLKAALTRGFDFGKHLTEWKPFQDYMQWIVDSEISEEQTTDHLDFLVNKRDIDLERYDYIMNMYFQEAAYAMISGGTGTIQWQVADMHKKWYNDDGELFPYFGIDELDNLNTTLSEYLDVSFFTDLFEENGVEDEGDVEESIQQFLEGRIGLKTLEHTVDFPEDLDEHIHRKLMEDHEFFDYDRVHEDWTHQRVEVELDMVNEELIKNFPETKGTSSWQTDSAFSKFQKELGEIVDQFDSQSESTDFLDLLADHWSDFEYDEGAQYLSESKNPKHRHIKRLAGLI